MLSNENFYALKEVNESKVYLFQKDYLEKKFQEGRLVYGFHVSDRALMTCLVFDRDGRQVHFVDGADGGYALAAKKMKERMKS